MTPSLTVMTGSSSATTSARPVDQRLAGAEQHGDRVDCEGIEQPGVEALPGDVGAGDSYGLLARQGAGLTRRAGDPVGDERERRIDVRPVGGRLVGDDDRAPAGCRPPQPRVRSCE